MQNFNWHHFLGGVSLITLSKLETFSAAYLKQGFRSLYPPISVGRQLLKLTLVDCLGFN